MGLIGWDFRHVRETRLLSTIFASEIISGFILLAMAIAAVVHFICINIKAYLLLTANR